MLKLWVSFLRIKSNKLWKAYGTGSGAHGMSSCGSSLLFPSPSKNWSLFFLSPGAGNAVENTQEIDIPRTGTLDFRFQRKLVSSTMNKINAKYAVNFLVKIFSLFLRIILKITGHWCSYLCEWEILHRKQLERRANINKCKNQSKWLLRVLSKPPFWMK